MGSQKRVLRQLNRLLSLSLLLGLVSTAQIAIANPSSSCGYLWEWVKVSRFPVQPTNGWAAYSYLVQHSSDETVGYVMRGQFPYGTYTGWDIYGEGGLPVAVIKHDDMIPHEGSLNPYEPGTPMLTENRDFSLLMIPESVNHSNLPLSLRSIPNFVKTPVNADGAWVLAIRLYGALPEYNLGGYGGPDGLDFPTTTAVNLFTAEPVDCTALSVLGENGRQPNDMPTRMEDAHLADGIPMGGLDQKIFLGGPTLPPIPIKTRLRDVPPGLDGFEVAPILDPNLIQFTRPPLAPGAGVPSIPPPDACSGYLGASVDPDRIALIRVPQVPTFLSNKNVTADTLYEQEQVQFYGMTMYGSDLGFYLPGAPYTNSLGNEEFTLDNSGGATILVWPRGDRLSKTQKLTLFAYAQERDWVLLRGGEENEITSANILVRQKGAAANYSGGFEPTSSVDGVPCFFEEGEDAPWSSIDDVSYAASPSNMGAAAPQGVYCNSVSDVLKGRCEIKLREYISSTGGKYNVQQAVAEN